MFHIDRPDAFRMLAARHFLRQARRNAGASRNGDP